MSQVLVDGLAFPESPRWHEGRLWFANWGTGEILAVGSDGRTEVMATVPAETLPISIDWLPDGTLLVVANGQLLRQNADGELVRHTDLGELFNEIVVDERGNAYVNGGSSDFDQPGVIVVVAPDGSVRQVAEGIEFGNGMAITADGGTLVVAESFGCRLSAFTIGADGSLSDRRVWADLGDGHPDGICLDAEGAIWYADVPARRCVRVREGGEVLQTVEVDRGAFACMLNEDTLFMLVAEWRGFEHMFSADRAGQVLTTSAPSPHAGRP